MHEGKKKMKCMTSETEKNVNSSCQVTVLHSYVTIYYERNWHIGGSKITISMTLTNSTENERNINVNESAILSIIYTHLMSTYSKTETFSMHI
mmetsp:Transcript_19279/g.25653  ORF Transcript_19279/g.25653 Transcript_19279/m.25653 type:complete len:93 (+) Transcript_19279:168-446(+)